MRDVDVSLAPIDVGFDPRVHEMLCTIPASAQRVRYERPGEMHIRIAEGTTDEIVAELTAAGYSIHVDTDA